MVICALGGRVGEANDNDVAVEVEDSDCVGVDHVDDGSGKAELGKEGDGEQ